MALRTWTQEALKQYPYRVLVLFSEDPDVIRIWSDLSESLVTDPMIRVPFSPTQVAEYNQGRPESVLSGPFTRERLLDYCLSRSAQSLRAPRPISGLSEYTSKFYI